MKEGMSELLFLIDRALKRIYIKSFGIYLSILSLILLIVLLVQRYFGFYFALILVLLLIGAFLSVLDIRQNVKRIYQFTKKWRFADNIRKLLLYPFRFNSLYKVVKYIDDKLSAKDRLTTLYSTISEGNLKAFGTEEVQLLVKQTSQIVNDRGNKELVLDSIVTKRDMHLFLVGILSFIGIVSIIMTGSFIDPSYKHDVAVLRDLIEEEELPPELSETIDKVVKSVVIYGVDNTITQTLIADAESMLDNFEDTISHGEKSENRENMADVDKTEKSEDKKEMEKDRDEEMRKDSGKERDDKDKDGNGMGNNNRDDQKQSDRKENQDSKENGKGKQRGKGKKKGQDKKGTEGEGGGKGKGRGSGEGSSQVKSQSKDNGRKDGGSGEKGKQDSAGHAKKGPLKKAKEALENLKRNKDSEGRNKASQNAKGGGNKQDREAKMNSGNKQTSFKKGKDDTKGQGGKRDDKTAEKQRQGDKTGDSVKEDTGREAKLPPNDKSKADTSSSGHKGDKRRGKGKEYKELKDKRFREVEIHGEEGEVDTRYLSKESEDVLNKGPAKYKRELMELKRKREADKSDTKQLIPLEYKDIIR